MNRKLARELLDDGLISWPQLSFLSKELDATLTQREGRHCWVALIPKDCDEERSHTEEYEIAKVPDEGYFLIEKDFQGDPTAVSQQRGRLQSMLESSEIARGLFEIVDATEARIGDTTFYAGEDGLTFQQSRKVEYDYERDESEFVEEEEDPDGLGELFG